LGYYLSSDLAAVGVVAENNNRKRENAFYTLSVIPFLIAHESEVNNA